jgi:hypothetical protein
MTEDEKLKSIAEITTNYTNSKDDDKIQQTIKRLNKINIGFEMILLKALDNPY